MNRILPIVFLVFMALTSLTEAGRFDTGTWPDGIGYSPLSATRN